MNKNKLRHQILGLLAEAIVMAPPTDRIEDERNIKVPLSEICENLNVSLKEVATYGVTLLVRQEMHLFKENGIDYCKILPNGIVAYTDKFYIKEYTSRIKDKIDFWSRNIIPIIAIIVSIIAIYVSLAGNNEAKGTQTRLNQLEKEVEKLQAPHNTPH